MFSSSSIASKIQLDPNSYIPLYQQLSQHFRQLIANDHVSAGALLATEAEISEQLGVSRVTVRKALALLEEEGLVVRQRGKGTFVAPQVIVHELRSIRTLLDVINEQSQDVRVELVERRLTDDVPATSRETLKLDPNSTALLIRRLHVVEDVPVALAVVYVHPEWEPILGANDLRTSSIYTLLNARLGISVAQVSELIYAAQANEEIAQILELPLYSPVLVMESSGADAQGVVIDHSTYYLRPDRYKFSLRLEN